MKTIIAGSRDFTDYDEVVLAIKNSGIDITEVVCGKAPGVDSLGERWAKENNIPVAPFPALWDDLYVPGAVVRTNRKTGRPYNVVAGFQRNQRMADYADALIAVWRDKTPGTADMIRRSTVMHRIVHVHTVK